MEPGRVGWEGLAPPRLEVQLPGCLAEISSCFLSCSLAFPLLHLQLTSVLFEEGEGSHFLFRDFQLILDDSPFSTCSSDTELLPLPVSEFSLSLLLPDPPVYCLSPPRVKNFLPGHVIKFILYLLDVSLSSWTCRDAAGAAI